MELEHYYNHKELYSLIIDFIEDTSDVEDSYLSIINFFETYNYKEEGDKLSFVINLISKIADNHHRNEGFFDKIERIILYFSNEIHQYFTNSKIFDIFKNNARVISFLFREKILLMDEYIYDFYNCQFHVYSEYDRFFFFPEFSPFYEKNKKLSKIKKKLLEIDSDIFDTFDEKREIGENDLYICQLIRKDLVDDFIVYITKNLISLDKPIKQSIFETNSLLKKSTTMIEYAAFFGSIQIFQYLYYNNVKLNPTLWIYAIHSQNAEIIHLLEYYCIPPPNNSYEECFIESIKCHHNNIAEYIIYNLLESNEYDNKYYTTYLSYISNNVNFNYITLPNDIVGLISQERSINKLNISDLCINLNRISIPPSVTSIGSGAFKNCSSLKEIFIPSSVTSIGSEAFSECNSLLHICIPSSINSIESGTFQKCISLTEISIPSSVKSIGNNAFCNCTSLQKISIPSSVASIGNNAFCNCFLLQEVSIPSSVTEIGSEAFKNCHYLLTIEIPSSVKILGLNVFHGCMALTELSIKSSIGMRSDIFMNCKSLKKIVTAEKQVFIKRFAHHTNCIIVKNELQ